MNRYDHQFAATCPTDGTTIIYHLNVKTDAVVMAEAITDACKFSSPTYHEVIADELVAKLGGRQTLRAMHQGVHITTKRGSK